MEERFMLISQVLKDFLLSEDVAIEIDAISEKYQLSAPLRDMVLEEVGRVVLGLTPRDQLKDRLTIKLGLPRPRMIALAAEIDRDALSSIHKEIEKVTPGVSTPEQIPVKDKMATIPTAENPEQKAQIQSTSETLINHITQFQERKKMKERGPGEGNDPYRESVS